VLTAVVEADLAASLAWPRARHVLRVQRRVVQGATGALREEPVYGSSNLGREQAGAGPLAHGMSASIGLSSIAPSGCTA
jgi:hypothetical protein